MANPQPDEFTRISNELYTALMQTNFSKRQRNILDLVIRMSYGCGKKTALLRPVDFELVGVYKSHIKKELKKLQKAKVIFVDGNQITFNKDYEEWGVILVKGASVDRFNAVLKRNLDAQKSYQNSNLQVTETVTDEQGEVTKTVTDGYQNSNLEVTETVTDQDTQTYSGTDSGDPKEKERNLKDIIPPLPPKNEKPKTIEDILTQFPRYSNGQWTSIRDYWGIIKSTRQTGKVAASIVIKNMDQWERFPVEIVLKALQIHGNKYKTKRENYTLGIMRGLLKEGRRDGAGSIKTPAKTGIIDRSKFTYRSAAT